MADDQIADLLPHVRIPAGPYPVPGIEVTHRELSTLTLTARAPSSADGPSEAIPGSRWRQAQLPENSEAVPKDVVVLHLLMRVEGEHDRVLP